MSSSISTATAQSFSREDRAAYYTLRDRPTDQFSELIRFRPIHGHAAAYPAVNASDLAAGTTVVTTTGQSVSDTLPSFSVQTGKISHIAANLTVNSSFPERYGSSSNLLRELITVRIAAVIDKWRTLLVTGNSGVAGEFDGLSQLALNNGKSSPATDPSPMAGEIENLVASLDAQGAVDGRFLVMNQKALNTLWSGNYKGQIAWGEVPEIGPVPMISGTPVLTDNFIPNNNPSTGKTAVYAVLLRGAARVEALYPAANASKEITVRGPTLSESNAEIRFTVTASLGLAQVGNAVAELTGINAP